jgi:uncharacterized DUF497 family protein
VFSWDPQKAIANFEKHEISFDQAVTIFADIEGLDWQDNEHSGQEQRSNGSVVPRPIISYW